MYKLIYLSSATDMVTVKDLVEMLRAFREKNRRLGITGILIHRKGSFVQLLEGSEHEVRQLYTVISVDPRHRDCTVIDEGRIAQRCLGQWEMDFREYDGQPIFTADELKNDGSGVLRFLNEFVTDLR